MLRGKTRASVSEETAAVGYFKDIFSNPEAFPFSFTYDQKKHVGFKEPFVCETKESEDDKCLYKTLIAKNPKYRLQFRVEGQYYKGYATYEWVVYCRNIGKSVSKKLTDLQTVSCFFEGADPVLHHQVGDDPYYSNLYRPFDTYLTPGMNLSFAPMGGRSCAFAWPYYKLEFGGHGRVIAIGWSGGWKTDFKCSEKGVHFSTQQEYFNAVLNPDEEIRTPSVVFLEYEGNDEARATNLWRRWMLDRVFRKPHGEDIKPFSAILPSFHWLANEKNSMEAIDDYRALGINPDVCWIDAAWYRKNPQNESVSRWEEVGEQVPDPTKYTDASFATLSKFCHERDMQLMVWFETERVLKGTGSFISGQSKWLLNADTKAESAKDRWANEGSWYDDNALSDYSNPEYLKWIVEQVDRTIIDGGIDIYRQDSNMSQSLFWAQNETEDRVGVLENKYISGFLAYWDELIKRHPDMLIDACASGGRRNDIEMMKRSVSIGNHTDYSLAEPIMKTARFHSMFTWLPLFGEVPYNTFREDGKPLEYNLRASIVPYPLYTYNVTDGSGNLTANEKKYVDAWREVNELFTGDFYPLTKWSKNPDDWNGWQFLNEADEGFIQLFRRTGEESAKTVTLHGLDPEKKYCFKNLRENESFVKTGAELMSGITVTIENNWSDALYKYSLAE